MIAALSTGVVVVEASARSGALNTAGHTDRIGRLLMAVPGPVTSALSDGCHTLLRSETGSTALVTGVDDVVTLIGSSGDLASIPPPSARTRPVAGAGRAAAPGLDLRERLDSVDATARAVYDGLPSARECTPDELAVSCALSILEVIRALPGLELAGLVEATGAGYRRTRAPS